jgi:PAS domain S-box-containing protein
MEKTNDQSPISPLERRCIASEVAATSRDAENPFEMEIRRLHQQLTAQLQRTSELEARLQFENLLSGLSTQLISATDDLLLEPLRSSLSQITQFAGVERAELYLPEDRGGFERRLSVGRVGPETTAESFFRFGDTKSASIWFWTQMTAGQSIRVRSNGDLPPNAAPERARVAARGVLSTLITPLRVGDSLEGILALETYNASHTWPEDVVRKCELLAKVLAGALHRRRIHLRLVASEAQFRSVVQGQEEFILRWEPSGKITFASAPWRRYMGIGSEAPIRAGFWDCIQEGDRRTVHDALSTLSFWNTAVQEEHAVIRPDGAAGWHHWTHRIIYSGDGERIEYQSVGRDVTRLKAAELALAEQRSMLAHATRIATMSEMVGGISHEVNQPLYAIKNFGSAILKMLDRGPVDLELIREWASMISTSAERAGEIIRRLREFLSGKQVDWQSERIADLVQGAVDMVGFELAKQNIQLKRLIEPLEASVEADRVQLQQVLINLLRNSIEALQTKETDRQISIAARSLGGRVVLEVADNGPGIPSAAQRNLFQAFQTTKPDGMGLGLTISRTIVQAHGGSIEFRPAEPSGAVFTIVLAPRRTSESARGNPQDPSSEVIHAE